MKYIDSKISENMNSFQILLIVVFTLLLTNSLFGQEITFLPDGVSEVSYEVESISADFGYNNSSNKKSLKGMLLDRYNIDDSAVGGGISYQSIQHNLRFQYGLFETLNVGVTIPYISNSRESSLSVKDSGSTKAIAFVDSYESAESSGVGDYELWVIWRLIYTDSADFRFGFSFVGDNAPEYYNDPENVAIGSGAQELFSYIHWLIYPNNIDITGEIKIENTNTLNSSVEDPDGRSYELKRGNSLSFHTNLSMNAGGFNFGGGLNGYSNAETLIDGKGIGDGHKIYTVDMFVNYGNLDKLETQSLTLPYMVQFKVESPVYGVNTSADLKYGIKTLFYF